MLYFLNPRLWLLGGGVLIVLFSHFYVYKLGGSHVRTEWNLAKAEADRESRKLEQLRQANVDAAAVAATKRKSALVVDAAGARAQRDGLRDERDAIRLHAAQSLAAATLTVAAYEDLFGQCVRRYSDVAEAADRATSDALMLLDAWPK